MKRVSHENVQTIFDYYYHYRVLAEMKAVERKPVLDALKLLEVLLTQARELGCLEGDGVIRQNLALPQWHTGKIVVVDTKSSLEKVIHDAKYWLETADPVYAADGEAIWHLLYHSVEQCRFHRRESDVFDKVDSFCVKYSHPPLIKQSTTLS